MHRFCVAVAVSALAVGCALGGPRDRGPVSFETPAQPRTDLPFPNWPVPPERAELLLGDTPIDDEHTQVLSVEGAGGGVTGAHRDEIRFGDEQLGVKWKRFPVGTLEGANNSPRRELAAYELQKLFLEPEDYVVPDSSAAWVRVSTLTRLPSSVVRVSSRAKLGAFG